MYNTLIYPHLLYGIPIWGNADNIHLNPLLTLQKKAVRLIVNKHKSIHTHYHQPSYTIRITVGDNISNIYDVPSCNPVTYWYVNTFIKVPSDPIFKELGILKIHDIYKLNTLIFVYESLNKLNPNQFHSYYNYPTGLQNTAANRNNNLDPPVVRTNTYGLKGLKYSGCKLWNNLSTLIRNSVSKNIFKSHTKKHFINSYSNSEDD